MMYLISYDISDSVRLKEICKFMEGCGVRVQKSVFYTYMDHEELDKLRASLLKLMDKDEDSILIYPVCGKCEADMDYLGVPTLSLPEPSYRIL